MKQALFRFLFLSLVLLLVTSINPGLAQCLAMTGGNASFIVPSSAERPEDLTRIWAEDPRGTCVGEAIASRESFSLTIWGADQFNPAEGGIQPGETWRLRATREGLAYTLAVRLSDSRTYLRTEPTYAENAIYLTDGLAAPDDLFARLDSLADVADSLRAVQEDMAAEITRISQLQANTAAEREDQRQRADNLEATNTQLQSVNNQLQATNNQLQQRVTELEQSQITRAELDAAIARAEQAEAAAIQANEAADAAEAEVNLVRADLDAAEEALMLSQQELERARANAVAAQNEAQVARDQLAEVQQTNDALWEILLDALEKGRVNRGRLKQVE